MAEAFLEGSGGAHQAVLMVPDPGARDLNFPLASALRKKEMKLLKTRLH